MSVEARCWEVSNKLVVIVHVHWFTVEQTEQILSADFILAYLDTHAFRNLVHVLLADKLMVDSEAAAVLKNIVQVTRAHGFAMLAFVAAFWDFFSCLQMLDHDRITWAHFEAISLHALAKEHIDSLLVTKLNVRLHGKALTSPEIFEVLLANPL